MTSVRSISPNQLKEVRALRERLENQNCHIAMLERHLRAVLKNAGLGPVSLEARPPAVASKRWCAAPPARTPAPDPAFWPTPAEQERPLQPAPGRCAYAIKSTPLKVIGISVCGFGRDELESIVELVEQHHSKGRNFLPVFLTDSTEANIFRRRGFVFEYLPPPDRVRVHGSKPWAVYAAERRRLLARKWSMADIIAFGEAEFGRPHSASGAARADFKGMRARGISARGQAVRKARTAAARPPRNETVRTVADNMQHVVPHHR